MEPQAHSPLRSPCLRHGPENITGNFNRLNWDVDKAVEGIMRAKGSPEFARPLSEEERGWPAEAVEDPDTLFIRERLPLMHRLVEQNLIMDVYLRQEHLWMDQPPPERDPELGVGRDAAWQTPIHREAAKKALDAK